MCEEEECEMTLLREAIGDSLRRARLAQHRTLREVSGSARVSLGYLSEVERGRKEASSELLAAICSALDVPLSRVLWDVSTIMADADGFGPLGDLEPVLAGAPAEAGREAAPERGAEPAGFTDAGTEPTGVIPAAERGAGSEAAAAPAGATMSAGTTGSAGGGAPADHRPAAAPARPIGDAGVEVPGAAGDEAVPVPAGIGTGPDALGAPDAADPPAAAIVPGSVVVTPGAGRPLPVETRIVIPAPRGDALALVNSW